MFGFGGAQGQAQAQGGFDNARNQAMAGWGNAQNQMQGAWGNAQNSMQGGWGTMQQWGNNAQGAAQGAMGNAQKQFNGLQQQGQGMAAGYGFGFGGQQQQGSGYQPRSAESSSASGFFGGLFGGSKTVEDKRDEAYVNLLVEISYCVEDYTAGRAPPKDILSAIDQRLAAIKTIGSVDEINADKLLNSRGLNAQRRMQLQGQIAEIRKKSSRRGICC